MTKHRKLTSSHSSSQDNISADSIDLTASMHKLENIVQKMQTEDLDLEKSLQSFSDGVRLVKDCQEALNKAQQKVEILMQDVAQNDSLQSFSDSKDIDTQEGDE